MRLSVFVEVTLTVFILPCFGVFGNIDYLGVFEPDILDIDG